MIQHTNTSVGLMVSDGVFWYLYFVASMFVAYFAMRLTASARGKR